MALENTKMNSADGAIADSVDSTHRSLALVTVKQLPAKLVIITDLNTWLTYKTLTTISPLYSRR